MIKAEEIVNILKKLIEFKSKHNEKREIQQCLNFIRDYLKDYNHKFFESNGFSSLVLSNYSVDPSINYDFIFHGHVDVVAENSEDQFNPIIKEGKVYGRGALDMKGGIAVLLYLFKKYKFKKKILFMLTSDEEIGGENGTGFLFKKIGFKGKFFLTAEGEKDYLLKVKQKGVLMLRLLKNTKGGHSAYTWESKNAIEEIFKCFLEIKSLFPENISDPEHWYTTINLGKIKGGVAVNSIPDYAEGEIDIRFCEPYKTAEEVYQKVKDICRKYDIKVKRIYSTNLMDTDIDNDFVQKLNNIAKKKLNFKKDLFFKNHGTNDARFANAVGIPAVAFGPIGDNYHAKEEYVLIDSLVRFGEIILEFIRGT